jgi:hypothetical protein
MRKKKARNWKPCRVCRHEHQNPASSTLCSLECHKQEVGITMRKPLTIEIGDTVESRGFNKGGIGVCIDIHVRYGTYRISWDDYNASWCSFNDLTLIKKGKKEMKEFTKSDLKEGMFVKFRRGGYRVVLGDYALDAEYRVCLLNIKDNLLSGHDVFDGIDIMAVYRIGIPTYLSDHLKGNNLELIWERTEQTEAQKEIEVLQDKMEKAKEAVAEVQEQITKLQSTL